MASTTQSSKKAKDENDQLKVTRQMFRRQLASLKEMFPGWTEEDLLHTLMETEGDVELAVGRISEGHAHQWGEVKSRKGRKDKPIKAPVATEDKAAARGAGSTRGGFSGRGRGANGLNDSGFASANTSSDPGSPGAGLTAGETYGWPEGKKEVIEEIVMKTSWAQIAKPKITEVKPKEIKENKPNKEAVKEEKREKKEEIREKKEEIREKKEEFREKKEEFREEIEEVKVEEKAAEKTIVEKLEEVANQSPPKKPSPVRVENMTKPPNLSEKFSLQFGSISLSQPATAQEPTRYEKTEYPPYAPRNEPVPSYTQAPAPAPQHPPQQEAPNFHPIPQNYSVANAELGNLYQEQRGFYDQQYPAKYENNSASPTRQTQPAPGNPQGYPPYVPMYYMSNQYGANMGGYSAQNSFPNNAHSGYGVKGGGNYGYGGKMTPYHAGMSTVPFEDGIHPYNGSSLQHSLPLHAPHHSMQQSQEFRPLGGFGGVFSQQNPSGKYANDSTMYVQASGTASQPNAPGTNGTPANGQAPAQGHNGQYYQHSLYNQPVFGQYVVQPGGSNMYPSNYQMQFQHGQQRAGSQQGYWQG